MRRTENGLMLDGEMMPAPVSFQAATPEMADAISNVYLASRKALLVFSSLQFRKKSIPPYSSPLSSPVACRYCRGVKPVNILNCRVNAL